jgi:hypothetical protein
MDDNSIYKNYNFRSNDYIAYKQYFRSVNDLIGRDNCILDKDWVQI